MKKSLIITLFCLFSFSLLSKENRSTVSNTKSFEVQQTTGWELIGDITAISEKNYSMTGSLYVRLVGGKEFYKVRIVYNTSGDYRDCSVALGNYVFLNKHYNAKFSLQTGILDPAVTYYCNI